MTSHQTPAPTRLKTSNQAPTASSSTVPTARPTGPNDTSDLAQRLVGAATGRTVGACALRKPLAPASRPSGCGSAGSGKYDVTSSSIGTSARRAERPAPTGSLRACEDETVPTSRTIPAPSGPTYRICFVCTGNICRSPIAETVMRHLVDEAGLTDRVEVDSAGTGSWHVGDGADGRAVTVLRGGGYDGSRHRARRFERAWFDDRDLVVALDGGHLRELRAMAPSAAHRDAVRLLRDFDHEAPAGADVADPYYGGPDDFRLVLEQVERACRGLVRAVARALAHDRV